MRLVQLIILRRCYAADAKAGIAKDNGIRRGPAMVARSSGNSGRRNNPDPGLRRRRNSFWPEPRRFRFQENVSYVLYKILQSILRPDSTCLGIMRDRAWVVFGSVVPHHALSLGRERQTRISSRFRCTIYSACAKSSRTSGYPASPAPSLGPRVQSN